jgi:hypothetical protein
MNFDPVVSIELTDEKPDWPTIDNMKTFYKITTQSGKQYSLFTIFPVDEEWQSVETPNGGKNNIKILHNFQKKAMIDIEKNGRTIIRQGINSWNLRNRRGWKADE